MAINSGRENVNGLPHKNIFHQTLSNGEIKKSRLALNEPVVDIFMKCPITCCVEILEESVKLHTTVYNLNFTHGKFNWVVKRSYANIMKWYAKLEIDSKLKGGQGLPKLPKKVFGKDKRLYKHLEEFLNDVLNHDVFRCHHSTLKFLEVSWLSFIDGLGSKHREGYIKKKAGDHHTSSEIIGVVQTVHSKVHHQWSKRWLVLKDTYLAVIRPADNLIREVILMDQGFYVVKSPKHEPRHSMKISNLNRDIIINCPNRESLNEWVNEINAVACKDAEDFVQPNRLDSFAPVRTKVLAKWFVDGSSYFDSVAEMLENAKEEIFITDWMLSPELYLRRPITEDAYWRLDKVLQRKAESGVRVFVIIFEDVKIAMGLGSIYTRRRLLSLHPNIKVLRRRGFAQLMVWSPHDKMVIVDQQYAFFGGLDMCFGRWDDHSHKLIDLGTTSTDTKSNFRSIVGSFATQMATAPVEVKNQNENKQSKNTKDNKTNEDSLKYPSIEVSYLPEGKLWPGKDYMNFIFKDFQHVDKPFEDLIIRSEVPRMPWHDIACFVQGYPARDLARHFIQRWNMTKLDEKKEDISYPLLLPRGYGSRLKDLKPALTLMTKVNCQMLRSASKWSAGIEVTECSIHRAYIKAITEAEHFIYIENQFFVSLMGGSSQVFNKIADCLYERIVRAHNNKQTFRVYVVMPLLPGIEGDIKSQTGVAIKAVTHYNYASICRGPNSLWGRLQQLDEGKVNPANFLTFCALRTHEIHQGDLVSELVYVHSKLMVVDDRVAIIGSANINDRSMNGSRDCEVAAIFEDVYDLKDVKFDGQPYRVGHFVSKLRKHIFREHLGLMDKPPSEGYDLSDPVCDHFFNTVWQKVASKNTKIYEEVFHCIPNDSVRTISELQSYVSQPSLKDTNPGDAKQKLNEVEGHLVLLPFFFLSNEDLAPAISTKEGIMPNLLWT